MAIKENITSTKCSCYIIKGKELVIRKDNKTIELNDLKRIAEEAEGTDLFEEPENDICVLRIDANATIPADYSTLSLREHFAQNEEEANVKAFRAKGLSEWRANTQYCCKCGTKLVNNSTLTAKDCPECKQMFFPRIDPCVIVVVNKGDQILLARHVQRNQDIYACIAGFMEAGESAEHAVRREVLEETGLKIKNIKYRGSQSWPFPQQLMLGFTAEYESGEIKTQEEEISDAQWFDRDKCPASPQPGSIAYQLIHEEI